MRKITSTLTSIGIPIAISLAGLLTLASLGISLQRGNIPSWIISENRLLNFTFTMKLMGLAISFAAMALLYAFNKKGFTTFLKFRIALSTTSSSEESNWTFLGPVIAVAFTLGTLSYMSIAVSSQNGQVNGEFYKLLPLVILFAATNAWTEEIVSRFVIVSGLYGKLNPNVICLISAIIFGAGHFFGTPNGLFGMVASGALGWFLAKSVVETKSLGWALLIHFLQDIVIFGTGAMISAGRH